MMSDCFEGLIEDLDSKEVQDRGYYECEGYFNLIALRLTEFYINCIFFSLYISIEEKGP